MGQLDSGQPPSPGGLGDEGSLRALPALPVTGQGSHLWPLSASTLQSTPFQVFGSLVQLEEGRT